MTFQGERRSFWDAPTTYMEMSSFFYADQIQAPLLMYHGEKDNNSGTFIIQSERMMQALTGLGQDGRALHLPVRIARAARARELPRPVGALARVVRQVREERGAGGDDDRAAAVTLRRLAGRRKPLMNVLLNVLTAILLSAVVPVFPAPQPDDFQRLSADELKKGIEKRHPAAYYLLAQKLFASGGRDEAVFWFYAGQLRYRFHLAASPELPTSGDPALFASLIRGDRPAPQRICVRRSAGARRHPRQGARVG